MKNKGFTSRLVHADRLLNSPESGAVHQATSNSVLFEYQDAQELVDVFQGKKVGHVYSRSSSGSNAALQTRCWKPNGYKTGSRGPKPTRCHAKPEH